MGNTQISLYFLKCPGTINNAQEACGHYSKCPGSIRNVLWMSEMTLWWLLKTFIHNETGRYKNHAIKKSQSFIVVTRTCMNIRIGFICYRIQNPNDIYCYIGPYFSYTYTYLLNVFECSRIWKILAQFLRNHYGINETLFIFHFSGIHNDETSIACVAR